MAPRTEATAEPEISHDYCDAVDRLTQQVQVVGDILDEIREELQWAVRNGELIRLDRITATAEDWVARMKPDSLPEDSEQIPFCCENPNLQWEGDSDHPGVSCKSCGYCVCENGALVVEPQAAQKELF